GQRPGRERVRPGDRRRAATAHRGRLNHTRTRGRAAMPTNTSATSGPPESLLSSRDLASWLNVLPRTVQRMARTNRSPPPLVIGGRLRWQRAEVEEWLRQRRRSGGEARRPRAGGSAGAG